MIDAYFGQHFQEGYLDQVFPEPLAQAVAATLAALALAGPVATLDTPLTAQASLGSVALAGQGTSVTPGPMTLPINVGAATLTGQTAAVRIWIRIEVNVGTVALSGASAAVTPGPMTLPIGMGAATLMGQSATLNTPAIVVAGLGAAALTGQATGIATGAMALPIGVGAVTLAGVNPTIRFVVLHAVEAGMPIVGAWGVAPLTLAALCGRSGGRLARFVAHGSRGPIMAKAISGGASVAQARPRGAVLGRSEGKRSAAAGAGLTTTATRPKAPKAGADGS